MLGIGVGIHFRNEWNMYRRNRSSDPLTLFGANLKGWWRSKDTSTITHVANAVSSWANQGTLGGNLAQATAAKKPTLTTLRGIASLSFDGGDYLVYDGALADFKFAHDGSGAGIWVVCRVTAGNTVVLDNSSSAYLGTASTGISIGHTGTQCYGKVANGGGVALSVNQAGRTASYGGDFALVLKHATADAPDYAFHDNGRQFTGAYGAAAGAGNPGYLLTAGADSAAGGIPFTGHVLEIGLINISPTDAQVSNLYQYIGETYDIWQT